MRSQFSDFPCTINTKWNKEKIISFKENIFCVCRGFYDSEMIKCSKCKEWFRVRCLDKHASKSAQIPSSRLSAYSVYNISFGGRRILKSMFVLQIFVNVNEQEVCSVVLIASVYFTTNSCGIT